MTFVYTLCLHIIYTYNDFMIYFASVKSKLPQHDNSHVGPMNQISAPQKKIDPCLPWNGLEKPSGTDFFEATEAEVWSNLLASWGPWVYKMLPKHYPP